MAEATHEHHDKASGGWLIFFFVCFAITMAIGLYAVFTYDANAPEPVPGAGVSGGH